MTRSAHFRPEDLLAHSAWARDLARRLVADDATADDVVQDTFAAALAHPPREAGPLRPWLARVLGNAVRMRARGAGRRRRRERGSARDEALPSAAELTEQTEAQRLLMDALLELAEAQREVVLLRYFEGLSSAEIARRQGVPAGTVRARLKHGLDALRARLDGRFGGERGRWQRALAPLALPLTLPRAAATHAGAAGLLAGAIWMKLTLYAVSAAAGLLLIGFVLVATGAIEAPFGQAPPEDVRFEPPAHATPAAVDVDAPVPGPAAETRIALTADEPPEPLAEPDTATVRLRFIDAQQRPVPGVTVRLSPSSTRVSARSGTDGSVALEFVPFSPNGRTNLKFACPGFAADSLELSAEAGEVVDLGAVLLHAGGSLAGQVVDEAGTPLAEVDVRVPGREVSESTSGGMRVSHESELGAARTTTDAEGRFRLTGLLAGEVRVEAESADDLHEGKSARVEIRPGEESTGLVIVAPRVPAGLRIEGLVLDPSGEPVARASVSSRYRTLWSSGSQSITAGRDGRFRLVLRKKVEVDLEVRDPKGRWSPLALSDVEPGTLDLVLRFEEAEPLELRLTGGSGVPVTRASIAVLSADGERHLQWESDAADANGIARLRLPGEPFRLEVVADGHARAELGPFDPAVLGAAPVAIELAALPGLSGRVLTAGVPAAGARLFVHALARQRSRCNGVPVWVAPDASATGSADADGHFDLTLREPGRYVLRAELEGRAPTEHGPFDYDPAQGLQGVTLTLGEGGALEGRVVRADGLETSSIVLVSRGDAHALTQRTPPDGSFRFEHLMPGPWQVLLVEEELSPDSRSSSSDPGPAYRRIEADCRVFAGETTRYDLGLGAALDEATLHGRLHIAGADVTSWTAELLPLDEEPRSAAPVTGALDGEGRFTLAAPRAGRYRLVLTENEDPGALRLVTELDLAPGESAWAAQVTLGTLVLTGLAAGEEGLPVAALWRGEDGLWAFALARGDDAGRARLTVPAGKVEVVRPNLGVADDPREWPIVGEVVVGVGSEAKLEL